jgi:hypothetical protein
MARELISRRLRSALADFLSACSTRRRIGQEFEAEGVPYRPDVSQEHGGRRRPVVHGYYTGEVRVCDGDVVEHGRAAFRARGTGNPHGGSGYGMGSCFGTHRTRRFAAPGSLSREKNASAATETPRPRASAV